jgi:N-acetylmuramoyl-L-alanine amidase
MLGLALAGGCAAAVAASSRAPQPSDVAQVRLGGDQSATRVVVDLRTAVTGEEGRDSHANRIALVLRGAVTSKSMKGEGRGLVRSWRIDDAPGGARLTLELNGKAQIARRFLLPPADGVAAYRYVVDVTAPPGAAASARSAQARDVQPVAVRQISQPEAVHARKIVVIDPGHGGRDPGAAGAWSYEKNVTLATALALKAALEHTGRYQVVMTRVSDVYVPLEERVRIARKAGADLFLSLHADSGPDAAIHGASVYTLSERGEQRVGYVLGRHEWFLQEAKASDDQAVGQILLDLTQRSTRNRSAAFAQTLIEHVGDRAPLLPRSQRDAGYFVLLAPDVPAALLEMGFITNPGDEGRLNDARQRAALVGKIAQAIDGYFAAGAQLAQR